MRQHDLSLELFHRSRNVVSIILEVNLSSNYVCDLADTTKIEWVPELANKT